jgi:hypothetical protein
VCQTVFPLYCQLFSLIWIWYEYTLLGVSLKKDNR